MAGYGLSPPVGVRRGEVEANNYTLQFSTPSSRQVESWDDAKVSEFLDCHTFHSCSMYVYKM